MSAAVRKLFSEMMAEAARMPDFNYRSYFLRCNFLVVQENEELQSLFIFRRITHSFKEGEEFRKDEDIHKWEQYLKMTFEYGHIYESIYMNNESQVFGLSTDQLGHAKAPGFYWGALQSKV